MAPLYISYYTIGNGYEAEAAELVRTLKIYDLPHYVAGVRLDILPNSGSPCVWQRATQYKAEFILDVLRTFPDRPVVWVDADARLLARPAMFDWLRCDVAAHWYRNREMLTSTIYLAAGAATRELVEAWIRRNRQRPDVRLSEQRNLQYLVERARRLKIVNLPPEYAWIDAGGGNDMSARTYGWRMPVIRQGQASRRLKAKK